MLEALYFRLKRRAGETHEENARVLEMSTEYQVTEVVISGDEDAMFGTGNRQNLLVREASGIFAGDGSYIMF